MELNKRLVSTKLFLKVTIWTDAIVKASFVAAYLIAENQNHLLVASLLSEACRVWQV